MSKESIRSLDEYGGEEWVPVCPGCLEPCDQLQYYCENCGCNEAINPLVPYMPFTRIRFNVGMFGKLWRQCADVEVRPWRRLFDLIVLVLFCLMLLVLWRV